MSAPSAFRSAAAAFVASTMSVTVTPSMPSGDTSAGRSSVTAPTKPTSTPSKSWSRSRPGRHHPPCESIDAAARTLIDAEGYGDAFFHRDRPRIGLEGHEDPYLVADQEPLADGMAFSVEPGIYLTGRYGARIEDIVACGPDGPIVLNEAARELYVVDG